MSPVSSPRQFYVNCLCWAEFGHVIEADTIEQAIAKAKALRDAEGFASFEDQDGPAETWEAWELTS